MCIAQTDRQRGGKFECDPPCSGGGPAERWSSHTRAKKKFRFFSHGSGGERKRSRRRPAHKFIYKYIMYFYVYTYGVSVYIKIHFDAYAPHSFGKTAYHSLFATYARGALTVLPNCYYRKCAYKKLGTQTAERENCSGSFFATL